MTKPISATSSWHVLVGFISFMSSLALFKFAGWYQDDIVGAALFCSCSVGATHFLLDSLFLKVHLRPSTGLDFSLRNYSVKRTGIKLLGLLTTLSFFSFLYILLPEYQGAFYLPYWNVLKRVALPLGLFLIPYIFYIDSKMKNPKDSYYDMGLLTLGKIDLSQLPKLKQHFLTWLVKAFFLPLMFVYFCNYLTRLKNFDMTTLNSFSSFYTLSQDFIFLLDVGVVTIGYLLSLRLFDSHVRSAEPTFFGWIIAIICYEPFWSTIGTYYLSYSHSGNWQSWLSQSPVWFVIWGSFIIGLYSIYVWASFMFGVRFSNLTHRGIITNGPYRWTKHPAYLSKNLSWWFISVPFLAQGGPIEIVKKSCLLLALNLVYFLRAKTEEKHLGMDPTYQNYALWIQEHGFFALLKKKFLALFKLVNGMKKSRPT
jgi:isoprenylcysteine carboxyl methyltransferase (ICMT) family protein YpbQ